MKRSKCIGFFRGVSLILAFVITVVWMGFAGFEITASGEGENMLKKYECEDAMVFDSTGLKKIAMVTEKDAFASGGATAASTGGKFFLFEDVPESNFIHVAYASHNTSTLLTQIRYPGEENFETLCSIDYSTSNSWFMDSSYIATSPICYIPEGSAIRIKPQLDVNLDYIYFTFEQNTVSEEPPAGVTVAASFNGNITSDYMAPYGKTSVLNQGDSFIAKLRSNLLTNILNVSYTSKEGATVSVEAGGEAFEYSFPKTPLKIYKIKGVRTAELNKGSEIKVTCISGSLSIAYFESAYAEKSVAVNIPVINNTEKRSTYILDGTWDADAITNVSDWTPPEKLPDDLSFANSAPVPGLWGDAACSLGDYQSSMMVLRRKVVLEEEPAGTVLLNIGSAMFGRHIYVNGTLAGSYEYNYSSSSTDISGLLGKGENEIAILLGSFISQWNNPKTPAHVLYDGESSDEEPGVIDSVELVFCGEPDVTAVQLDPDIDLGTIDAKVTLANRTNDDVSTYLKISVYELGVFKDRKPLNEEIKVTEYTENDISIKAGESLDVFARDVLVSGFTKEKCWSPESPYLYRAVIETSGDAYSVRFGMRTFEFEAETGYALLNGERRFLFGTNVAIERFFDDPLCGTSPWNESFIRKLYSEYRSINWTCFRTHLGHANSKWFDIADEMGMMIFDEYPTWGNDPTDTLKTIMPEICRWIEDRGTHPSVIVFDAQNESTNSLNDQIIKKGREYDISHRPWENGWRPPVSKTDPVECHPYIIGTSGISGLETMTVGRPIVTTADVGWTADEYPGQPFILNEHGEYWINREGKPMSGTAATWNIARPGITDEERLEYYCELMSAQMEAFRSGRAYTGLLFFCGLASSTSSARGVTSDVLDPDISTPESLTLHPYFKYLMENTFAPLGITIGTYIEKRAAGSNVLVPVTLINDTGKSVENLDVTLVIKSGDKVLYADRKTMSVPCYSPEDPSKGTSTETFDLTVPNYSKYCKEGTVLTVQAYYSLSGKTVFSQRKWELSGGTFAKGEPEKYSWLNTSELPKKFVREDYIADKATLTNGCSRFNPWPVIAGAAVAVILASCGIIAFTTRKKRHFDR